MTEPERLSAALHSLHWSPRVAAEQALGIRPDTMRKWLAGRMPCPPAVLLWLETLAAFHDMHPAPTPQTAEPDDSNY